MLRYNKKGFSLFELLITVSLISVAIVFVFRSFLASIQAAKLSEDLTSANFLAESKIWEIAQAYKNNIVLPMGGVNSVGGKDFKWYASIFDSDISAELKMLRVYVRFREKISETDKEINFLTYLEPKNEAKLK